MYASAKAWIAHMEQHHSGTQWICYACSPSEPRIFVNRQAYLHHFSVTRQHEGQENESQLRQLVELTMIPVPLNFTNCPLCRWSESAEPYSFQLTTIQDHIANHLHAFSFRSLPEPEVDQSSVLSKESAVAGDSSLNSSCYSFSNNDSEFSEGSSKARNDDEHLGVEEDWSYISNRQLVVNEPPLKLIMKDSSRSAPDLVIQELESPNTSRNQAQMPTRSILCHFCEAIADFFYNLDFDLAAKEFPFHRTRRDIYTSARLGCPLCTEFMKSIIEGSEEILDLSSLGPERDQSANTSFTVFFTSMQQDRTLELRDVYDPSSPIYKFELYCDRSAPAKLLQWTDFRSTFQDFGSPSAIEFMKKCFSVCRQSHYDCSVYGASPPARLLDLGDNEFIETIRVVNPKQSGGRPIEFAFLSASWGSSPAFRLTQQSYAEAKQGIILERIARTIRDAVYLTRALGLRYLWVDSLCILQDSIEDWENEVSVMPSYLSNSAITLAATSSASLADGFLFPRAISRDFVFPLNNPETISHLEVLLRPSLPSAWESLQGDPLMKRLWCLQKVTLSPRVVHFGSSRLVWSCGTMTRADDSDTDKLPM
ncbi:heterokaryon incompatibility protein-domain-containing protein [Xylaria arbuscula]|nr:heterokaryon incompatibility protein-domain-containing protein [Xylaria arbuscula]